MGAALCFLVRLHLCKGLPLMEDADRLPIAEDEVDDLAAAVSSQEKGYSRYSEGIVWKCAKIV